MGRSFRTCLLLTAFQELSGLQQKVHHLLLGPRKSLPMASKGCLFLLFSAVSQCLLCYPVCPILLSGFREGAITPPSVRICFTQNPATRARQRTDLLSAAIPIFLKKEQEIWYPIILQTNNAEVICSPATWC